MSVQVQIPASSIRCRKEFHAANKDRNESIEDWYCRLRELAQGCDYGYYLEVFLLNQFIVGLDTTIFEHLCAEQRDLSLNDVIALSRNYEFNNEHVDIKPVLVDIKQEQPLSDEEHYDGGDNRDEDYSDNDENNIQPIVPFMAETIIESPPLCDRPKLFECYLCHKTWRSVGHLTYHFVRNHTIGKTSKCHLCGKWITNFSNMVRHLNVHLSSKPYHCDICDFSFSRSTSLTHHISKHNDPSMAKFECLRCQKPFIAKRHLQIHQQMHDQPPPSLSQKLDEIVKERKLTKTKSKTMAKSKPFHCEICLITFEDENSYDDHMKVHCETEWLCHLCGRKLKNKRNLIHHYRVHTGEKPFKCTFNDCDREFACKEKLKLHSKGHNGVRPHVCLICNKSFIQKGHLESHRKSHFPKELEFKCDQCPKQFTRKEKLDRHVRIHSGLKPFECAICEKTFNTNWHRMDHERTHTGERPYQCHLCDRRFIQSSTLRGHLKWHAKPKTEKRSRKKKSENFDLNVNSLTEA